MKRKDTFEIDADSPEEAEMKAIEEFIKKHPEINLETIRVVSEEKIEIN